VVHVRVKVDVREDLYDDIEEEVVQVEEEDQDQAEDWSRIDESVQELFEREDSTSVVKSYHPDADFFEDTELTSLVELLRQKQYQGKTNKDGVVIGTPNIIKRDFQAVSDAYTSQGIRVLKASEIVAAVRFGRIPGNLRSVRAREWRVILCLSLQTEKCLTDTDFVHVESLSGTFVNRIAGLARVLWSKDNYCNTVRASGYWQNAFTFPCWVLPRDGQELIDKSKTSGHWIVKPYKQGGGNGIFVLDGAEELLQLVRGQGKFIVQPYLETPHLLEGRKWDLRTYVLVTGVSPFARVYVYSDGLVRLATERYNPDAKHGGNKTQFLTNTSVNRKYQKDASKLTWSFARLEEYLGNADYRRLFSKIKRAIAMLMVTAETAFSQEFRGFRGGEFTCENCFHLLGVDLIVDQDLSPRVIEVNGEPSMQLTADSTSEYDQTKQNMQHEVAKIALGSGPQNNQRIFQTTKHKRWLKDHPKALEVLLKTSQELSLLENFRAVYPDEKVCTNPIRAQIWDRFIEDPDRKIMHELVHDLLCSHS